MITQSIKPRVLLTICSCVNAVAGVVMQAQTPTQAEQQTSTQEEDSGGKHQRKKNISDNSFGRKRSKDLSVNCEQPLTSAEQLVITKFKFIMYYDYLII